MSHAAAGRADLKGIMRAAKDRFLLNLQGIHGIGHWERVRENGLRLAKRTGADPLLVELFACLHDCCRERDGGDYEHGERAARFAASLQGSLLNLNRQDLELLCLAIRDHNKGLREGPVTVLTCWDADRLDLGRVWTRPDRKLLCTEAAREGKLLEWAYRRSVRARD